MLLIQLHKGIALQLLAIRMDPEFQIQIVTPIVILISYHSNKMLKYGGTKALRFQNLLEFLAIAGEEYLINKCSLES